MSHPFPRLPVLAGSGPRRTPHLADSLAGGNDEIELAPALDVAFATHLTLVVPARIDFAGGDPHALDLVIARAHCRGLRPRLQAVLDAAQAAWTRTRLAARLVHPPTMLSARVDGQWRALCTWPGAAIGLAGQPAPGLR